MRFRAYAIGRASAGGEVDEADFATTSSSLLAPRLRTLQVWYSCGRLVSASVPWIESTSGSSTASTICALICMDFTVRDVGHGAPFDPVGLIADIGWRVMFMFITMVVKRYIIHFYESYDF